MVDIKLLWFTNGKACVKCIPDGIEEDTFELCLDVEKREIVRFSHYFGDHFLHSKTNCSSLKMNCI